MQKSHFYKFICSIIYTIIILLSWGSVYCYDGEAIELLVNQQKTISIPGYSKIFAVDKNIVSIRELPNKNEVILTGVADGFTTITILYIDGRSETVSIKVISYLISVEDLTKLIGDIYGIEFMKVGSNIAIKGGVHTRTEYDRFQKVLQRYSNLIDLTENLSIKPNIELDVKVFEISRDSVQDLGIEWMKQTPLSGVDFSDHRRGINYKNLQSPSGGELLGEEYIPDDFYKIGKISRLSPILTELRLLAQNGKAKLLAKPKLLAENGGKASFLVGGEVPYPVEDYRGVVTVQFKEYGTKVVMEPVIVATGAVSLKVEAEVSELDYSNSVLGAPGLKTRNAETLITVPEGEAVAIAGLLTSTESITQEKIPILGNLPFIGDFLFGSTLKRSNELETIILITPTILLEGSNIAPEEFKDHHNEMKSDEGDIIPNF